MLPDWLRGAPSYPTMDTFYAERGGARSGESDFGVWWYDGEQAWSGCWRVSAVMETGDVYALCERAQANEDRGVVVLLGNMGGPDLEYTKSLAALEGWEQVCGAPDSLRWAFDKVRLVSAQISAVEPGSGLTPAEKDARALDELAEILRRKTWPSGADFLVWTADIVRATGRDIS